MYRHPKDLQSCVPVIINWSRAPSHPLFFSLSIISSPGPFVSLNRFERKKNVGLAIEALAVLRKGKRSERRALPQLIIAGGYDSRVTENVEYLKELKVLAAECGVEDLVSFAPSVSDAERNRLLQSALCVIYTPENEHFGIVPVEAMYAGAPVLAANSGGPRETVLDGETGFLRSNTALDFAAALQRFVDDPSLSLQLGKRAHDHVVRQFGMEMFSRQLDDATRRTRRLAAEANTKFAFWHWLSVCSVLAFLFAAMASSTLAGIAPASPGS